MSICLLPNDQFAILVSVEAAQDVDQTASGQNLLFETIIDLADDAPLVVSYEEKDSETKE